MKIYFNPKKEGLIIVPTEVIGPHGNSTVRLALDTGAMDSMINAKALFFLGYDKSFIKDRIQLTTGSGVEWVPRIYLNQIEALGLIRKSYSVISHTLPSSATVDGVLGLDFFRDQKLEIDFRKGLVQLSSSDF